MGVAAPAEPNGRAVARPAPARTLRPSERRFLALLFDAGAITVAVLLSLWTWSLTAGYTFSLAFVAERAWWLLAIPVWLFMLAPRDSQPPSSTLAKRSRGSSRRPRCWPFFI